MNALDRLVAFQKRHYISGRLTSFQSGYASVPLLIEKALRLIGVPATCGDLASMMDSAEANEEQIVFLIKTGVVK